MNVLDSRCGVWTSLEHLSDGPRNKFQVIRGTPETNSKSNQIKISGHPQNIDTKLVSTRYILNLIRSYVIIYYIYISVTQI
jgi:hypothetical protein